MSSLVSRFFYGCSLFFCSEGSSSFASSTAVVPHGVFLSGLLVLPPLLGSLFLSFSPFFVSLFWSNLVLSHDLNSPYMLESLKSIAVAQCSFLSSRCKYWTVNLILLLECLVNISNLTSQTSEFQISLQMSTLSTGFSILVNYISVCPGAEGYV